MMFSLFEISVSFKSLCKMNMSVFQKVFSILSNKSYHMIILFSILIHIDRKIRFICSQIHFLGIFKSLFSFKFLSFFDIKHRVFWFREISWNQFICLFPFICYYIHFKGFNITSWFDEIFFCEIELSDISIMMGYFCIERSSNFFRLSLN